MTKYSRQRKLILDAVKENYTHPTADEVYNELRERLPTISLGTVYRNLNRLAEEGVIVRLRIAEGPDRFDCQTQTHYHMRCRKCGALVDLMTDYLEDVDRRIAQATGQRIESHSIMFEGICADCLKKTVQ
ncbi:MAG: transcriptional repressor [Bacillota bacterium]|nr:transcriptional repressor [Bacillota bacterium]